MPGASEKERWSWARWTAAGVLALSLYVLSAGPAIWLSRRIDPHHTGWAGAIAGWFYGPLIMASRCCRTEAAALGLLESVCQRHALIETEPDGPEWLTTARHFDVRGTTRKSAADHFPGRQKPSNLAR